MASNVPTQFEGDARKCGCVIFPEPSRFLATEIIARKRHPTQQQQQQQREYTDSDLARDMQQMSFQERQRINEEIHLVGEQVEETEEFVEGKVKEVIEVLNNQSKGKVQRDAWDRAVFIRPDLAVDRGHYLMFLRAKDYDPFDAAMMLLKNYEAKRVIWGDKLLPHRISWEDLTDKIRAIYGKADTMNVPRNNEESYRRVWYYRASIIEPGTDWKTYYQAVTYPIFPSVIGNDKLQREGTIQIFDFRGQWQMSPFEYLNMMKDITPLVETFPMRVAAMHFLVENASSVVRSVHSLLTRNSRIRVRIHSGSWMEIKYSLRTYGVDIGADWLEGDVKGSPFSTASIEAATREYLRIEEEWKRKEAPYRDPASNFALYPNPQDILMGKNRNIAASWPGNVAYMALIHEHTASYGIVTTRSAKIAIAIEILERLKRVSCARFLNRREGVGWDALSDEEARCKISQSLRDEYRKIFKTNF